MGKCQGFQCLFIIHDPDHVFHICLFMPERITEGFSAHAPTAIVDNRYYYPAQMNFLFVCSCVDATGRDR